MWKNIAVSAARRATYKTTTTVATKRSVGALRTLSSMSYGESITVSDDNIEDMHIDILLLLHT